MNLVTIALPVRNEIKNIKKIILNIIAQTHLLSLNNIKYEFIISDNNSIDGTSKVCLELCKKYKFIKYYRHQRTIDIFYNFFFLLKKSNSKYFTWQAADDLRSKNFLLANIKFLENDIENLYSASTGISFLDKKKFKKFIINFSLIGKLFFKILCFFKNKWISHGMFYSVIRTNILKKFPIKNFRNYLGRDWVLILFLIKEGNLNRINSCHSIFGSKGLSFKKNTIFLQRSKNPLIYKIENFFPFFMLFKHACLIYKNKNFFIRFIVFIYLFLFNLREFRKK